MLQNPPAADWLSFRRSLNAWGYSPFDQIDGGTVKKKLHEVWSGPVVGSELTPLVHDGVMYPPLGGDGFVSLDAATGKERWRFARELPNNRQHGGTKRNIAIYQELLISTSNDGSEFAVDARTGEQVWEVKVTSPANTSSGPIIADGKVSAPSSRQRIRKNVRHSFHASGRAPGASFDRRRYSGEESALELTTTSTVRQLANRLDPNLRVQ